MATRPDKKVIRIVDEVDAESWIKDREYRDAVILGPAVLLPSGGVKLERVGFSGEPDSIFIELPPGKPVQGVVGLQHVTFVDCLFHDVAIIGTAATLNLYRQGGELVEGTPEEIEARQADEAAHAEAPEQPVHR
jgi:hypothetical protein